MAKDNIDSILVRLDEIEKLQTELRHLVPRVTSNSSRHVRHQDLSRDSSTSIRFPSLFTFPVISDFTSAPKNERVQKSAAQLSLSNKLSSGNRSSTVNLKNAGRSSQSGSSAKRKETNIFKNLLKSSNNVKSHVKNSLASTSVMDSKTSMMPTRNITASRAAKHPQEVIEKGLKNEMSKTAARSKTQCATNDRSNMRLSKNENVNSIRSSVQTSDIQVHAAETIPRSHGIWSRLKSNLFPDRSLSTETFIKRIMEKLNYCFVDDKRVTVPSHYPGNKTPTRVQVSYAPIEETKTVITCIHDENLRQLKI